MFLAVDTQWSVANITWVIVAVDPMQMCSFVGMNFPIHQVKTMILWLATMMWMNFIDLWKLLSLYHFITYHSSYHLSHTLSGNDQDGLFLQKETSSFPPFIHEAHSSPSIKINILTSPQQYTNHFQQLFQPAWTPSFSKSFSANFKVKTLEFFSNIVAKVYQKRDETLMSPTVWTDLFRDFKAKLINKLEASVLFPLWFFLFESQYIKLNSLI